MHNIYLLEQTLQREITERREAVAHLEQIRALRAAPATEPVFAPTAAPPRVILRFGRLALTWIA